MKPEEKPKELITPERILKVSQKEKDLLKTQGTASTKDKEEKRTQNSTILDPTQRINELKKTIVTNNKQIRGIQTDVINFQKQFLKSLLDKAKFNPQDTILGFELYTLFQQELIDGNFNDLGNFAKIYVNLKASYYSSQNQLDPNPAELVGNKIDPSDLGNKLAELISNYKDISRERLAQIIEAVSEQLNEDNLFSNPGESSNPDETNVVQPKAPEGDTEVESSGAIGWLQTLAQKASTVATFARNATQGIQIIINSEEVQKVFQENLPEIKAAIPQIIEAAQDSDPEAAAARVDMIIKNYKLDDHLDGILNLLQDWFPKFVEELRKKNNIIDMDPNKTNDE